MTIEDLEEILPRNKRLFLKFSNILIAVTIVLDLFFITNLITLPLESFTLFNLIMLGISLYGYRIKRSVNEELAKRRMEDQAST